jgi:hypothetical protein
VLFPPALAHHRYGARSRRRVARVDWAIPCRYAEENGGLGTIVGAGIDTILVSNLPANIGLLIALRIVLGEGELEAPHELTFTLRDPSMNEVATVSAQLEGFQPNPEREPGWEVGNFLPTAHQFQVAELGTFTLEIQLDGRSQQTIPILVREQPTAVS